MDCRWLLNAEALDMPPTETPATDGSKTVDGKPQLLWSVCRGRLYMLGFNVRLGVGGMLTRVINMAKMRQMMGTTA